MANTGRAGSRSKAKPFFIRVMELPDWFHGGGKGARTRRDVLLSLASFADPDGSRCYPGWAQIARRAYTSERTARRSASWYKSKGRLEIDRKGSPIGTNLYRFILPADDVGPAELDTMGVQVETGHQDAGSGHQDTPPGQQTPDLATHERPLPSLENHIDLQKREGRAGWSAHSREETQKPTVRAKADAAFEKLCRDLYRAGDRAFTGKSRARLAELATEFSASEIVFAYREYIMPLDEFDMNRAPATFCDAARDILILRREEREKAARERAYWDERVRQDRERSVAEEKAREEREAREKAEADEQMADFERLNGIQRTACGEATT